MSDKMSILKGALPMPKLTIYNSKKEKLFRLLRSEMLAKGLQNADIARIINRTPEFVSRCLNNRGQFSLSDQYAILKAIKRPASEMHLIFPEGGVQIEEPTPTDNGTSPNQNKKPRKTDQSESPIDQILHTTAETLRLQADLLDKLAEARSQV